MSIDPGSRLAHYEVVAPLGAGGMGEVYRARDTRLNRDVAIKILPAVFTDDRERLARFEREAQVLASLNHPNIASIFGLEDVLIAAASASPTGAAAPASALVMELVDGDDLAVRIARGAVPADEAAPIARQIAEALEAAHEQGVVHRDLKPANVKVRPDGTVKVLDFGLAKAMDPGGGSSSGSVRSVTLMNSPTLTAAHGTQLGAILGTAAYMAPEQARGTSVDKRADIWAFGVVLYEMLTGRRLFEGATVSDVLAAVLRQDIDLAALPAATPTALRRLVARCLERDPKQRLRDIGEARVLLAGPLDEPERRAATTVSKPGPVRTLLPWAVAALALVTAVWALWNLEARPAAPAVARQGHFTIELPADAPLVTLDIPADSDGPLAISPDGRHVAYVAPRDRSRQLCIRAMADLTPRPLPGTEGAQAPFFSPDGQWVGFFADGKLKKTPLAGGTSTTLADAPNGRGGSWSPRGEIVYAPGYSTGLRIVPETGGSAHDITTLDFAAGDDGHQWPQVLPDQHAALFTVSSWSRQTSDVVLVDLSTGARQMVQQGAAFARYVPAAPGAAEGYLVFVREGSLVAAPFDPAGSQPAGAAVPIVDGVKAAQFDVSAAGVLVYAPGSGKAWDYSLVWVDRAGESRPINDLARGYEDLHLSPDGRTVALTIEESGDNSPAHVWLADTERGTLTRLTFDGFSRDPVWAPDGKSLAFGSKRGESTFGLYLQRIDGRSQAELIWASPIPIWPDPQSWTPDGRTLVFSTKGKETSDDIWTLSMDGERQARPWLQTPANEWAGRLSPDGRWMAYSSDESGRREVYVQPFPGPGTQRLVSYGGGFNPIWSRDGRQLFFRQGDEILAADVETAPGLRIGKPTPLFSGRYRATGRDFDVSLDGKRFVMMRANDSRTTTQLNVLLDWWHVVAAHMGSARP